MKKILLFLIPLLLTACSLQEQTTKPMLKNIRQPVVAGQFYPAEQQEISDQIKKYLKQAEEQEIKDEIKAIIVPHAGYDFSGPVAAYAFKQLAGKKINTVVIISNSHKFYFDGVAIDNSDEWKTPLGTVKIDKELAEKLIKANSLIKYNSSAHASDHPIEVEVPFLQTVLANDFKILPIMFGNKHDDFYKKLAKALKDNLSKDDLVVISTDMSHYPKYEDANKIDKGTLEKIKTGKIKELEDYIKNIENSNFFNEQTALCGIDAVKTAMELFNLSGWNKIYALKYANSGDAALINDKKNVVGYGAIVFTSSKPSVAKTDEVISEDEKLLNYEQQKKLLEIAKNSVENYVINNKISDFNIEDEKLNQKQGAFVTLSKKGQLRGCIGQIIPSNKPLWQVVRDMAIAACSEDNRFNPVGEDELNKIEYEISVLSEPEEISDWHKIKLGTHGVIIKKAGYSGVFLPQVAIETGWDLEKFLSELCWQKAGLLPNCYKDKSTKILIFTAQVFK